ncbi:MAG: sugar phosphate isomerase/epimerase, partial [Planctomycetes bacterium]|nr:sugar phosphate isomerase/epimerase [Planctomycetota bacterium]
MFFSGIADEAAPELSRQLDAHKELGWKHIELRMIESTNLTDLSDSDFDRVADQLSEAGVSVS